MSTAEVGLQQEVHVLYSNHRDWLSGWLRHWLGAEHIGVLLVTVERYITTALRNCYARHFEI